jgi:cell cycle checkpoint control protein RAD9A
VVISVKDFKAIVTHADTLDAVLNTCYTKPGRPLQFGYDQPGISCRFTLMTASDSRSPAVADTGNKATARKPSTEQASAANTDRQRQSRIMLPPPRPEGRRNTQTLGRRKPDDETNSAQPSRQESETLFVPQEDEDRTWDPTNYDDGEEMLAWDSREPDVSIIAYSSSSTHSSRCHSSISNSKIMQRVLTKMSRMQPRKVYHQHKDYLRLVLSCFIDDCNLIVVFRYRDFSGDLA